MNGSTVSHKTERRRKHEMHIREMRSALEAQHNNSLGALPAMPDWVVRRVFEKRNGLSLTPLPRGVEVRSANSTVVAARPDVAAPALASQSEREAIQRRIRATQISLLQ
jgi:hypothetical protein